MTCERRDFPYSTHLRLDTKCDVNSKHADHLGTCASMQRSSKSVLLLNELLYCNQPHRVAVSWVDSGQAPLFVTYLELQRRVEQLSEIIRNSCRGNVPPEQLCYVGVMSRSCLELPGLILR